MAEQADKPIRKELPAKATAPSIVSEVENLSLEMKPSDARRHIEGALDTLLDMAQSPSMLPHDRFHAIQGINVLYQTLSFKEITEDGLNKLDRANGRMVDEVRKHRRKSWETDEDGEE